MTETFGQLERATPESLAELGSLKWTRYPAAIGAWVAESDLGTSPSVQRALQTAVGSGLLAYPPEKLVPSLGEATAAFLSERYAWSVDPQCIFPMPDALKGLEVGIQVFTNDDSPVIVPTPAYMPFLYVPQLLGREVLDVPSRYSETGWSMDLEAIERAFQAGGRLLVLCNPHNPTGRVFTREELAALAVIVSRYDGVVFSDEVHGPLTYSGHQHIPYSSVSAEAREHSFTLVSASKAWNVPGLKCAQMIIESRTLREQWESIAPLIGHGASTLGMVANIAAYSSGIAWLDDSVAYLEDNRRTLGEMVRSRMPEVGLFDPQATYLAWLDCEALGIEGSPAEFFLDHAHVAMVDGGQCGTGYSRFVRFNFAMPRHLLVQAVEQMADSIARRIPR